MRKIDQKRSRRTAVWRQNKAALIKRQTERVENARRKVRSILSGQGFSDLEGGGWNSVARRILVVLKQLRLSPKEVRAVNVRALRVAAHNRVLLTVTLARWHRELKPIVRR